jgi:GNAT superfamily N-acetyltransferase
MTVRLAQVADAPAIAHVHIAAWRGAYAGLFPQSYLDALDVESWTQGWIRQLESAEDPHRAVLVGGDPLAGFAVVSPSRDDDAPDDVGELVAINLAPPAWGTGLGRALLEAATQHLRAVGFRRATLWVVAGNERAIRFYGIAGWTPDGTTKTADIGGATITEARYAREL